MMKAKKFFGFDEKFGHYAAMAGLVIITLIFCGEYFGWFGDNRYEEMKSKYREKVNLLTLQNQIQGREISKLKEQLRVLESSAKKPDDNQTQTGEVQVEEETRAHNPPQKNEFKASLTPSQKQEFDDEVEKAYAHLLANSGVEGELSDWQKQATRRSAETIAMTLVKTKWQSRGFLDRWDAKVAALEEETEEMDRLHQAEMEEEFLLVEEDIRQFEEEFGLEPFDWGSLEEVELSPAAKEEIAEEWERILTEAERMVEKLLKAAKDE